MKEDSHIRDDRHLVKNANILDLEQNRFHEVFPKLENKPTKSEHFKKGTIILPKRITQLCEKIIGLPGLYNKNLIKIKILPVPVQKK